jgi:hypothetical protein
MWNQTIIQGSSTCSTALGWRARGPRNLERRKRCKDPKTGQKYCTEACAKLNTLDDQEFQI